ncbi:MAG: glycosyltransferase family 39 protein [bacterium]
MSSVKSRFHLWLILLGLPFVVRYALWLVWRHGFTWGDGLFYATIAEQFFQFGTAHDYLLLFPPGYPLVVDLFRFLLTLDGALVLASVVAGSVLPLLVWLIARMITEERVAWYAWALTCCSPLLLGLSLERLADSLFIALIVGALGSLVAFYRTARMGWFATYCLLSALSVQTKPEGLVLVAVQSLLCLFLFRSFTPVRRLLLVGILWVTVGLVGLPYWFFLHERADVWILSGKAPLNLLHARAKAVTSDHSKELEMVYKKAFALDASGRLAFLTRRDGFFKYVLEDPARASQVYWSNVKRGLSVLSPAAIPLLVVMCIGIVGMWGAGQRVILVLAASVVVLIFFPPFFVSLAQPSFHPGRLAGPVVPSLILLASLGVRRIGTALRGSRLDFWIVIAWTVGCLVFACHETIRLDRANRGEKQLIDLHCSRVSRWLALNTSQDTVIASTSLLDDAYSGRRSVWLPWEDPPQLVDYLRSKGVTYLLQEWGGGLLSPGIKPSTVNPDSVGLEPIVFLSVAPEVTVYRILPGS